MRRLASLLLLLPLLAACGGLSGTNDGGYISGNGQVVQYAAGQRGEAVKLSGTLLDGTTFDPPLPIELAEGRAVHSPTVETQIQELGAAIEAGRPLEVERLRRRFEDSALRGRDATYVVTWRRWDVRDRFTCQCDIEWRELVRWETGS